MSQVVSGHFHVMQLTISFHLNTTISLDLSHLLGLPFTVNYRFKSVQSPQQQRKKANSLLTFGRRVDSHQVFFFHSFFSTCTILLIILYEAGSTEGLFIL